MALIVPLNWDVWATLIAIVAVLIIIYGIASRYDSSPDVSSWGAILIYIVGAFTQQGFEDTMHRTSSRVLNVSLLFMTLMVFNYYNASVLNGLLSPSPYTIFNVDQLLEANFRLGLIEFPYTHEFKSDYGVFGSNSENRDRLYEAFSETEKQSNLYYNHEEGLEKVKAGEFSFYCDQLSTYLNVEKTFSDSQICSLYYVNQITPSPLSPILRNNSPYTNAVATSYAIMSEMGLIDRVQKEWYLGKPNCVWRIDAQSIGPTSLTAAYLSIAFGTVTSVAILIGEIIMTNKSLIKVFAP